MTVIVRLLLRTLEVALVVMMSSLVLVVLWGVFGRFLLSSAPRWTEEVATYLLAWLSLLGAVVAYARNEHLGVDLLVGRWDTANQRLCALIVQCLVILFCIFVLIYGGTILVVETLRSGQVTPALGIRMGWVYLVVPVSGVLFVTVAAERIASMRIDSASDNLMAGRRGGQ